MIPNYRRIPTLVDAVRFSPDQPIEKVLFSEPENIHYVLGEFRGQEVRYGIIEGDWVLTDEKGSARVVPHDAFITLYEPLPPTT